MDGTENIDVVDDVWLIGRQNKPQYKNTTIIDFVHFS
jgi:hypothetical protein